MSLKEDMAALGRATARGPHHAKYFMYGEAAREMLTPEKFAEAEQAAWAARGKPEPMPSDPTAANPTMSTVRLERARGD